MTTRAAVPAGVGLLHRLATRGQARDERAELVALWDAHALDALEAGVGRPALWLQALVGAVLHLCTRLRAAITDIRCRRRLPVALAIAAMVVGVVTGVALVDPARASLALTAVTVTSTVVATR